MARLFGEISGNPPGTTYGSRPELAAARVHPPLQHMTGDHFDGQPIAR